MRILVATITHRADDARIFAREIPALLDAGHQVTAIAPWKSSKVTAPATVNAVNVPRTRGRNRLWPLLRGIVALWRRSGSHDAILVHDPELAIALALTPMRHKTVWDVHEDVPAALRNKSYLPGPTAALTSATVARLERWIEKRMRLILAEEKYVERFRTEHEVILNLPRVPETLPSSVPKDQVIYVGSITKARGLESMLLIARNLERHGISLLLIGEIPSANDRESVETARNVTWLGPRPNAEALKQVEESLAGLSLLADLPNYRHSMPTKVLEYMSRGVPVVSTPLALAQAALGEHGVIVSFDAAKGADEATQAILRLKNEPQYRDSMRMAAFDRVKSEYNWNVRQSDFVAVFSSGFEG